MADKGTLVNLSVDFNEHTGVARLKGAVYLVGLQRLVIHLHTVQRKTVLGPLAIDVDGIELVGLAVDVEGVSIEGILCAEGSAVGNDAGHGLVVRRHLEGDVCAHGVAGKHQLLSVYKRKLHEIVGEQIGRSQISNFARILTVAGAVIIDRQAYEAPAGKFQCPGLMISGVAGVAVVHHDAGKGVFIGGGFRHIHQGAVLHPIVPHQIDAGDPGISPAGDQPPVHQ